MNTHTLSFSAQLLIEILEASSKKPSVPSAEFIALDMLKRIDPNYPTFTPQELETSTAVSFELEISKDTGALGFGYVKSVFSPTKGDWDYFECEQGTIAEASPALAAVTLYNFNKIDGFKSSHFYTDEYAQLTKEIASDPEAQNIYDFLMALDASVALALKVEEQRLRSIWSLWPHLDLSAACAGSKSARETLRKLPLPLQKEAWVMLTTVPSGMVKLANEAHGLIAETMPNVLASLPGRLTSYELNELTLKRFSFESWKTSITKRVETVDGYINLSEDSTINPLVWVMNAPNRDASRSRALNIDEAMFASWVNNNLESFPTEKPLHMGPELLMWFFRNGETLSDEELDAVFSEMPQYQRALSLRMKGPLWAIASATIYRNASN